MKPIPKLSNQHTEAFKGTTEAFEIEKADPITKKWGPKGPMKPIPKLSNQHTEAFKGTTEAFEIEKAEPETGPEGPHGTNTEAF